jgi:hypothetical protein
VVEKKTFLVYFLAFIYSLISIIVRRLAKLNILSFKVFPNIMTLIRFVQRASILAGITAISLHIPSSPAHADIKEFCIVASNGKTVCGKPRGIERMCITTDSRNTVCGKFKSVKEGEAQAQEEETPRPIQGNAPRVVVDNVVFSSKGCSRSDTTVKCSFSMRNKGEERIFYLTQTDVTMTDSLGKTHKASRIEMLGDSGVYNIGGKFTPEIDYEAIMTFDNVPEGVKKSQVLSFPLRGKTVNLRNITISNRS